MGEIRFSRLGLNPTQFHKANPAGSGAAKQSAKPAPDLNAGEGKDTLSLSKRSSVETDKNPKGAALENPEQAIRLAVANDPRGGSLNPSTLDRLKNPPKDASGFNI